MPSGPEHKVFSTLPGAGWNQKGRERSRAGLALAATFISVFLGSLCRQNSIKVCNWSLYVLSTVRPVPSDVAESGCDGQMGPLFIFNRRKTEIQRH